MLEMGEIEESQSAWSSPVVLVQKLGKVRLCLDSRKVNAVTKKDAYPLPQIDGILSRLPKALFISCLDLKDAYWQIPLDPKSRDKTAFTIPGKPLYQYKVMPFGLKRLTNASQTMTRLMDKVIPANLRNEVFVYLDDLLVVSDSFETHLKVLGLVAEQQVSKQNTATANWRGTRITAVLSAVICGLPRPISQISLWQFKKLSADVVIKYMQQELLHTFGFPETIVSDNGSQFKAEAFQKFLRKYQISHTLTAAYSPQANASERVNRSVIAAIRSYVRGDQKDWDEQLSSICCALRSAVHSAIGTTPYYMVFGQHFLSSGSSYKLLRSLGCLEDRSTMLTREDSLEVV
ncbi:uncharacterized protein [Drosophila kikkawai]|uniref:Uncharacterized protein n=1 Tax=Drosophila kikkawai TaxID=30033 RepID=A0ABM4GFZ7_DROKI